MNINVAVQTDHGLFVPVVRVGHCIVTKIALVLTFFSYISFKFLFVFQDADKKGLATIADEVKQLAQRAKDNCLKPEDYEVWCEIFVNTLFFNRICP